ncbi:MAG TPA: transketolase C-terminal domain-containing protein, partial [Anaerolineales bacterium]|nr:transketolase C-terminal domain-containing protein [Anaerolineales bacterium]
GLAYASVLYREVPELSAFRQFSDHGNEVAFGTIGNASTAEGMFWEAVNAIGVLNAPAVISIYDDGYGISVPNLYQMVKQDLSTILKGFGRWEGSCDGFDLYTVRGCDYPALYQTYQQAAANARVDHTPAILHITELTQPQGHSTSGSHERYKSKERLEWEVENDVLRCMRQDVISTGVVDDKTLAEMEAEERQFVESERQAAWEAYQAPILKERQELIGLLSTLAGESQQPEILKGIQEKLAGLPQPLRRDLLSEAHTALRATRSQTLGSKRTLIQWRDQLQATTQERYSSLVYSESPESALRVPVVPAEYAPDAQQVYGYEILTACFDAALGRDPRIFAFGEDVGQLGDVNQGMRGLQEKYGLYRVADTGIREATILGQAIGMALRGLRPIAEIQYLDYLLYALQIMSDDLATLLWRTHGGQKAPVIVRTRGHRLEGIWHSGSPMASIIHLVRGMHVLVPRNMTQAAGFYNTLLRSDEPGLIIEVLNGYRLREKLPANIGEFTVPLGEPEILRAGKDITLVTYGACCRLALEASNLLAETGVDTEVIDVQSLLPFDIQGRIGESLQKTGRVVFVDEDMPGGTTAYMLQEVLEKQGGYQWLDSAPTTVPARPHRPAFGSDGDYFSKPNVEQIFDAVYTLMHESNPARYPLFDR